MISLYLLTTLLVALAWATAASHALIPGQNALDKEKCFGVQHIYYPGFTIAGVSEATGIILNGSLLLLAVARPEW